jgi:hypothetical protein
MSSASKGRKSPTLLATMQSTPNDLIVRLHASPFDENPLMPLTTSLRNLLWDVGMEFVYQGVG